MPRPNIRKASNRLAAVLIALVAVQILLSAVIPQQEFGVGRIVGTGEFLEHANPIVRALQLDKIYSSILFQVTLALLAIILAEANLRRFRQVLRARDRWLRMRHLGSMIFHLALLLVVGGILINAATHFDGVLGLTEGQEILDAPESYRKVKSGFLAGDPHGEFRLKLEAIERDYPVGDTVTDAALLAVSPLVMGPGARGPAVVNRPLRWRGFEFHLGNLIGYSPEIAVLDDRDQAVFRSFVRISAHAPPGGEVRHWDFQTPFADNRRLRITVNEDERAGATLDLAVLQGDDLLAMGRAAVGDTLELDGERLVVPRMRRWCYIFVVRNPWLWLVFTGFWLALAGQALSVIARTVRQGGSNA